ncbi:MAG: pyrimidine dimer DNA glycosylase/endonuclease V [Gemmatimonadaceae bacterium]
MRLWSLHPRYLDPKGLVALWREALLAQAVLAGHTRGYRSHPQLARFRESPSPTDQVAAYLRQVHAESVRRGYEFDASRIVDGGRAAVPPAGTLPVTAGQLEYEWAHLTAKLGARSPGWLERFAAVELPEPHPSFTVVAGGIADWEVLATTPHHPHRALAR